MKKRIGFIGACGHHGTALQVVCDRPEDCEIVGIAQGGGMPIDKILNVLDKKQVEKPQEYADWKKLLEEKSPDIVVVDGLFCNHAEMAAEALKRGAHVYCEKPLATTMEDLEMLEEAYRKAKGQVLWYMLTTRYDPWMYTAHALIQEGAVGEIRMVNGQKSYQLGKRAPFYQSRQQYGGSIPWVGIHAVDWILWLTGKQVKSVYAVESSRANGGNGEMESTGICTFLLEDEIIAHVNLDILRPKTAKSHGDDRVRVVGSDGVLEVRGNQVYLINSQTDGEEIMPLRNPPRIFEDFLAEIDGKGEHLLSAEESFYGTRICLLAREAADQGKVIVL